MSVMEGFRTPADVVTALLIDLFETIENSSQSTGKVKLTEASDIDFFIGKCSNYMKHKGVLPIMQGRDVRKGREGYTLLHAAAKVGNDALVQYMIDNGADMNAVDNSHNLMTPMMFSVQSCQFDACVLLGSCGADLTCVDANGENIFHYFARANNSTFLKKLVDVSKLGPYLIQQLAMQVAVLKKKPYPEFYAPDKSITKDILMSYRLQGGYVSANDVKAMKRSLEANPQKYKRRLRKEARSRTHTLTEGEMDVPLESLEHEAGQMTHPQQAPEPPEPQTAVM